VERLAVIVPVHNGEATLGRCLAALVAARPAGAEIVVVDDASTDASAAIAAGFPVRLLRRSARGGASAARNHGVAATDAALVGFVDADVVVQPSAFEALLAPLREDPTLLGANGLFSLALSTPGRITAFTNTSIHYQHLRHGPRVASAFTGLCVLRREALVQMGGWDERTSRFADDVGTRWHLPPGCIALAPAAQGEHLKAISLRGLLKHRIGVGRNFVESILDNRDSAQARPGAALLDARYPLNTLAAGLTLAVLPLSPAAPPLLLLPMGLILAANLDFVVFTFTHRGVGDALVALPVSALEGHAYAFGLADGLARRLWRTRGRTLAPAR
jgi:glycosyltransferase involved in cell wall biosynthesis